MDTYSSLQVADEIVRLFELYGNDDYDGEPVSQTSHMIQCAMKAMDDAGDIELILGALLHDVGHLLKHEHDTKSMGEYGVANHEGLGAEYLRKQGFSEKVCAMVEKHVAAKRYLVATDPIYREKLSPASVETLQWQGGPMIMEEAEQFTKHPYFEVIVKGRLWDEQAKDVNAYLLPLSFFHKLIQEHLIQQHNGTSN